LRISNIFRRESMNNNQKKQEILSKVKQSFGFIPNVIEGLAESPAAATVYLEGMKILEEGSLNEQERQTAILTISKLRDCDYCVAAHSVLADNAGLSRANIDLLKAGRAPEDKNLATVFDATSLLLEKQGWLSEEDLSKFSEKGLDKPKIFELIALIAMKTITNYVNHINKTEVDKEFAHEAVKAATSCSTSKSCGC